ncbi:MAG: 4-hydroxy-tetrahydrodipicolinate synthase [Flavobacteriaceae bacterium]|nr:4-hydroxy-tetrahydrodipicolinate synthase [Flavobacteriaceae bacterium]
MNLIEKFKGTGVAVVTPFLDDLTIDIKSINKLVDFLIEGGVDYIVVQGTTGESTSLSQEEKIFSRQIFLKANNNRVPMILGLGSNNTSSIVNDLKILDFSGFSAILSVTPYYNRPSQKGLYNHYSLISDTSPLPVILYNVPKRTGCNLLPETVLRLANDKQNIIGIKEASGNLDQISKIIANKPENFLILSGDDDTAVQTVISGGDGVISVAAGCIPKYFSKMINYALLNDVDKSLNALGNIKYLLELLFKEGNPSGIKSALSSIELCKNVVRLPLTTVSDELKNEIKKTLNELNKQ